MNLPASVRPSLVRTITLRLAVTSILAMLLQLTIVVARAYLNEDDLNRSYVARETRVLAREIRVSSSPKGIAYKLAKVPAHYRGKHANAYAFRVLSEQGRIVAEHNAAMLTPLSPWQERPSRGQDLWLVDLDAAEKLHVAGGYRERIRGRDLWIEVATRGDPDSVYLGIVAAEVLDDVWMPMIPVIVLTLGVAVISSRQALASLVRAAKQAQEISPLDHNKRFDASDMPREAAMFAIAINELLDRVGGLVKAQRMFIARAAHELRTPLAIMMLELGRGQPSIANLEADVRAMSDTVNRLLTLARLESIEQPEVSDVDVGKIARELADRLGEWVAGTGHAIDLNVREPALVSADAAAIHEALRNLIENAVRHTPRGTTVRVTVGPGGSIVVEDDGPGINNESVPELLQPFKKGRAASEGAGLGLAIVKQAVDLHRGTLQVERAPGGGARFRLSFPREQAAA